MPAVSRTSRRTTPFVEVLAASLAAAGCTPDRPQEPVPATPEPQPPALPPAAVAPTTAAGQTTTAALSPAECAHRGSGTDYSVGPGQKYASLGAVPFERLRAGDTVRVHWRPEPYREKLMISGVGTAKDPIRICGVPGPNGELPVIDGQDATTRKELDFPFDGHQPRGLIIVGHAHDQPYERSPEHVVIEGLEVRNASPPHSFTDKSGKKRHYTDVAAGIFVQRGKFVTIRGCNIHDNNNGLFIGTSGGIELTRDVLIENNRIWNNASPNTWYQHNVYNEASGVTYQFNHFGPPRAGPKGVLGANIKERSAGVVIRYNWIEDGAHLIDLVDAQEAKDTTVAMPSFHTTWVYGNVLVRGPRPSGSLVHYGGDSGLFENYRKGTLHFFNNTVVVHNESYKDYDSTEIFEISTADETVEVKNNVFFSAVAPSPVRPVMLIGSRDGVASGVVRFEKNWVRDGWTVGNEIPGTRVRMEAKVSGFETSIRGRDPRFRDVGARDFSPAEGSPLRLAGARLSVPADHALSLMYVPHQRGGPRPASDPPTLGAFP